MTCLVIHGPNLNMLGKRNQTHYGTLTMLDINQLLVDTYPDIEFDFYQSNHEGDIIDKLHEVGFKYDGIVLNAGAYTHYSYAIADAIKAIKTKVIEVHISDIYVREDFRKNSITGESCLKIISGKGLPGYVEAIHDFVK